MEFVKGVTLSKSYAANPETLAPCAAKDRWDKLPCRSRILPSRHLVDKRPIKQTSDLHPYRFMEIHTFLRWV